MPLNPQQKAAVEYLEGPLLVLAGPGTGKTQLLSKKVEYILQNTDTDPSMILCITYTEAGAKNMQERLRSMIGQAADQVDVMTFHSFGQKILSRYNLFTNHPQRTFSNPIDEVLQTKIISELQLKLPNSYLLKSERDPKTLISALEKIRISKLSAQDLRQIAKKNEQDIQLLNKILSPILKNIPPRIGRGAFPLLAETVYLPILQALGQHKTDTPVTGRIYSLFDVFYEQLYTLIEQQNCSENPSVSPINSFIKKYFIKDQTGEYKFSALANNKRLLELAELLEIYQTYLTEHDLYDFVDMIEAPIRYLEQDEDFRRSIAQNYLYIMIDEYQDTNPSQTKLLELIADEQDSPAVMAVGDDDQSIFEFQGAKASSLIHFKNHFNAKVIVLTDNYRSTSEILQFSRKIADQLDESFIKNEAMQHSLHTDKKTTQDLKKELTAIRNDDILKPSPVDSLFDSLRSSDTKKADLAPLNNFITQKSFISRHQFLDTDAEYHWIADRIHRLIQAGEKPSDIGVLFPKHAMATPLIPYLREYPEINISYERTENILEDQQIYELLTLCRFIHQLANGENPAHMLPEILSFDFWEIPSEDIVMSIQSLHRNKRNVLEILNSYHDHPLFAKLAAFFAELSKKSFSLPLEFFFDILIGLSSLPLKLDQNELTFTSPFLNYYAKDPYSKTTFKLYSHLHLLREKLFSRTEKDQLRLKDLVELLDDYQTTGNAITEQISYADSDNSINLMTAHKSKGLEFKHVFLIGANKSGWDGTGRQTDLSLPPNLEILKDSKNTPDGKKRLFFVAVTRAAKTLTITNSKFSNSKEKENPPLSFLDEKELQENGQTKLLSPLLPNQLVFEHNDQPSEADQVAIVRRTWINKFLDPKEDLKKLLLKRVQNFRLSASHLSSFIRLSYGGPLKFYLENILKAPQEPLSINLAYGTLIHRVFEEITLNQISKAEALNLYSSGAKKQDLLEEDIATLLQRGQDDLPLAIDTYEPILRADGAKAEVDFSNENLVFDGIPIAGKIDHLHIDEKNKLIDIYDFKTSTISDKDTWMNKESLYIYHFQLLFYRLLLKQSKIYQNYTVRSMNLLFTTPNRREVVNHPEGKMHSIELPEATVAKDPIVFEDLLRAVYHQITTLSFLDSSSPFALITDQNAGLSEIKNFCQQLIDSYQNH